MGSDSGRFTRTGTGASCVATGTRAPRHSDRNPARCDRVAEQALVRDYRRSASAARALLQAGPARARQSRDAAGAGLTLLTALADLGLRCPAPRQEAGAKARRGLGDTPFSSVRMPAASDLNARPAHSPAAGYSLIESRRQLPVVQQLLSNSSRLTRHGP